jgi:hypothetical protein
MLTPLVKEIRRSMLDEQIPDSYYSKSMLRACLLRAENQTISWEISYFNRDNPQSTFSIDLFNQFESILRFQTNGLHIDYITSIQLLLVKIDRNIVGHDSIKNFLRYQAQQDSSFSGYLSSMSMTDIFTLNQKLCLEILYRRFF